MRDWLTREPELRGRVNQPTPTPKPGQMGVLEDVLLIATGGGLGVLGRSLPIWLRHRKSDVEIEVENPGGRKVRLNARQVPDAEKLLKEVLDNSVQERPDEAP